MVCEYLEKRNDCRICTASSESKEAFLWCEKHNEYKKCYKRLRRMKRDIRSYVRVLTIGM